MLLALNMRWAHNCLTCYLTVWSVAQWFYYAERRLFDHQSCWNWTLVIKSNSCPMHYCIHKDGRPIKWHGQAEAIAQLNCTCEHTACGFVYRSNAANQHVLHGL